MIVGDVQVVLAEDDDGHVPFPVFVFTTTDNPVEILKCYALGAGCLVKPVDFGRFGEMVQQFARFLMIVQLPGEPAVQISA